MRPGITGWAVVNGRNTLQFKERVRLDVWYVDHWSIALDIRIILRTIAQVIHQTDVAVVEDDVALGFPMAGQLVDPVEPGAEPRSAHGSSGTARRPARPRTDGATRRRRRAVRRARSAG